MRCAACFHRDYGLIVTSVHERSERHHLGASHSKQTAVKGHAHRYLCPKVRERCSAIAPGSVHWTQCWSSRSLDCCCRWWWLHNNRSRHWLPPNRFASTEIDLTHPTQELLSRSALWASGCSFAVAHKFALKARLKVETPFTGRELRWSHPAAASSTAAACLLHWHWASVTSSLHAALRWLDPIC